MDSLYEIVNPSDRYTFRAASREIAAVMVMLLGRGSYGAVDVSGTWKVPLFLMGGVEMVNAWFMREFGADIDAVLDRTFGQAEPRRHLIEAFESVLIGNVGDRANFEDAIAAIPDSTARAEFAIRWRDRKRSSMNNIGAHAEAYAKHLRSRTRPDGLPLEAPEPKP